jgi:phospholipid/cholesterol/gamma-HCH transport system substrate-binding protein
MKQKTNIQKLKLGVFIVVGTLLFVLAIYTIGQKQNMFSNSFILKTQFNNINGLQKGNNVRFSGIEIGTVSSISMLNDSTIIVEMNVDEKITEHIKKNAIASIGTDGIVGNVLINIFPRNGTTIPIENGDIIESYSKVSADDMLNTLSATNENAAILMSNLIKITNRLNETKGTFGMLLNDSLMAKDLKQSIYNLRKVSYGATNSVNEFNSFLNSFTNNEKSIAGILLNDTISGKQLKSTLTTVNIASKRLDSTVNNLNQLIKGINSSNGAVNYITKDSILVNDLKKSIKNINEGTYKFNENMEALKHHFLFRKYFKKKENNDKN